MFDFGWAELLVIIALGVLVMGPDEIPAIMRGLGRIVRRLQYIKYAFSQQFEDFMKEHELEEMRSSALFRDHQTSIQDEMDDDLEHHAQEAEKDAAAK